MADSADVAAPSRPEETASAISSAMVVVLAAACGVAAASLYYAQPLLHTIAHDFHTSSGTAGLIVTFSQVGYAVGLALLVPVGDLVRRQLVVPALLIVCGLALGASALAPNIDVLVALALVIGVTSVVAQLLVPLAASLAPDAERGRVTGTVMSGLLLGILLARTLSGLIAGAAGWRTVYWAAFGLVALTALVLARLLPAERARPGLGYRDLLRSAVALIGSEALLRRRMLLGALDMACFSAFWTTAAFLLAGSPFHYSDTVIGLFGLIGAAGALCASFAGRVADRGHQRAATGSFSFILAASFVLLLLGRHSLGWLIAGVVALDVGVQGLHITNQSLIFRLAPEARNRINSGYMTAYFVGGAAGSAVAGALYASDGWTGVCVLGVGLGLAALAAWAFDMVRPLPAPAGA